MDHISKLSGELFNTFYRTIKTTADTYLDITEKIEEDELKKFASYTKRKI